MFQKMVQQMFNGPDDRINAGENNDETDASGAVDISQRKTIYV